MSIKYTIGQHVDDRTFVTYEGEASHPELVREAVAALLDPLGEVVVTRDAHGRIVAVTRQDSEGKILSVIAEAEPAKVHGKFTAGDRVVFNCDYNPDGVKKGDVGTVTSAYRNSLDSFVKVDLGRGRATECYAWRVDHHL